MTNSPSERDLKTIGYVLRRTNYGEADRILDLITPVGKIAVLARSARKAHSKLAGGIEIYTLSEFNIHRGRGKLGILTGARMQRFYSNLLRDPARMLLAAEILQRIDKAAEHADSPDYFALVDQSLASLNAGRDIELIRAWFTINLLRLSGEELNLYRDISGEKLSPDLTYNWHSFERAFEPSPSGEFSANNIKLLRLMSGNDLELLLRIRYEPEVMQPITKLLREFTAPANA